MSPASGVQKKKKDTEMETQAILGEPVLNSWLTEKRAGSFGSQVRMSALYFTIIFMTTNNTVK